MRTNFRFQVVREDERQVLLHDMHVSDICGQDCTEAHWVYPEGSLVRPSCVSYGFLSYRINLVS